MTDHTGDLAPFMAAIESGSRVVALEALRRRLAAACLEAEPRELAPLARQLQIVLADLAALTVTKGSGVKFLDDLSAKRKRRESDAAAV